MTLQSMTGFARSEGNSGESRWHWEARSVNGRGLDVRLRLPPGFEAIEARAREAVTRRVARGNLNLTLTLEAATGQADVRVNEVALAKILAIADRLHATGKFEKPRPEGVLALRGVLELGETEATEAERATRNTAMLSSLDGAIAGLIQARSAEGARLLPVLLGQIGEMERIVAAVAASPARAPAAIRARLAEQVQRICEAAPSLDEARLYQEAVLAATKGDVEEELKRLVSHFAAARELLDAKEPVGRKLDFLTQELNREANTLCSKAGDIEITRHGLALKAIVDQMREQVQNIE